MSFTIKYQTLLLSLLLCLLSSVSIGQTKVFYIFPNSDVQPLFKGKKIFPDSTVIDQTQELNTLLNKQIQQYIAQGYIAASIDSISLRVDSTILVYPYLGQTYKWAQINLDSIAPGVLNKLGIRKLDWHGHVIQPQKLAGLHKKIINHYENNGYPFAQIKHINTAINQQTISTQLVVDLGMELKIDTIIINSNVEIATSFIENYLGIKQRSLYNETQIKQISPKLKELAFLQEAQPWEMHQTIAKNELLLHLKRKKSNQINGLIGLQPNNNETGKMLLTVDALLDLKNSFGYGERIMASYQNLQKGSPKLILGVQAPYILGLPIAIDANFYLYKRDTLYTKINVDVGAKYLLNYKDYVKLSYIDVSYRVNYVDFPFIQREKRLPNIIDTRSNGVGLQIYFDKTDYTLSPRRGWIANVNTQLLNRNIKENLTISTFEDGTGYDYGQLYDTISLKNNQYKVFGSFEYYQPIYKTIIAKVGYNGGWIEGSNLFMNELYQIGGFNILRGFDEESIFTNQYHLFTGEVRFLINNYSFFYAFTDLGWLTSAYNLQSRTNTPLSIGAGLNLQNEGGIFRIAIGVGKNQDEPLRLRQAKLHFGYTALF